MTDPESRPGPWRYSDKTERSTARKTLLNSQGRTCAVCSDHDPLRLGLKVDHCHGCGWVRGVLCGRCNADMAPLDANPIRWAETATREVWKLRAYAMRPVAEGCECRTFIPTPRRALAETNEPEQSRPYVVREIAQTALLALTASAVMFWFLSAAAVGAGLLDVVNGQHDLTGTAPVWLLRSGAACLAAMILCAPNRLVMLAGAATAAVVLINAGTDRAAYPAFAVVLALFFRVLWSELCRFGRAA